MTEHVELRLTAYHDGALDAAESEQIRAHLDSCAACRAASEDHLRLESLLSEATGALEPSSSLWPGVESRLRPQGLFPLSLRLAGGMAIAAAAGILLSSSIPKTMPAQATEADLWTTLEYGLVDGDPVVLASFETGDSQ